MTLAATAVGTVATSAISTHAGTHSDPIPLGETADVTLDQLAGKQEYHLSVQQVIIGSMAEAKMKNSFLYSTPIPGNTYLVALIKGTFVSSEKDAAGSLSNVDFSTLSDGQLSPDFSLIQAPDPVLGFKGFTGAKFSGWIAQPVASADPAPLIVVGLNSFSSTGGIFFATK